MKAKYKILVIGCVLKKDWETTDLLFEKKDIDTFYDELGFIEDSISLELKANLQLYFFDAANNVDIPELENVSGIIVGGSEHMLSSGDSAWIIRLRKYLYKAANLNIPILGICFGHQLLAQMFGAKIIRIIPKEFGKKRIELTEAGKRDLLFEGFDNGSFEAFEVHSDNVITEITDSEIISLCVNKYNLNQAIAIGDRIRGVQFHPEFNYRFMRGILCSLQQEMLEQGFHLDIERETLNENPVLAKCVIDNFVKHFVIEKTFLN